MKNLFLLSFMLIMGFSSCNYDSNKADSKQNQQTDGVFIHLKNSYGEKHSVLMAFKMAELMSKDKDVIMYLDIDAVNLIVQEAKDFALEGFESYQTYLSRLIESNTHIYACPACLAHANIDKEDLLDGIEIAQKEKFFNFTKGRIISLDY
jgi:predicted peroxiredoxin